VLLVGLLISICITDALPVPAIVFGVKEIFGVIAVEVIKDKLPEIDALVEPWLVLIAFAGSENV
jgi:hypothetical protein